MAVRQRGKGWQVDVTLQGHGRLRPFFDSKEQADAWEQDARHAVKMGRPLPPTDTNIVRGGGRIETLAQLLPSVVMDWETEGCSSSEKLKRNVEFFLDWFGGNRHPSEVTEEAIDLYIVHLRTEIGNSGATVNRKVSALRQLLKKAKRYKLLTVLPDAKRFSENKGSLNWLNFGEETPILARLQHLGQDAHYDLICFLIDTGCRITEALTVEWKTIRSNSVTFENRKNGQFGSVPLTKRAIAALERRRQWTNGDGPFTDINYDGARHVLRGVYDHLGGEYSKITQPFHIYRHSCASRLAVKGINAKRIMEWMDHSSLIVTQRYMKLSVSDLDEARDALEPDLPVKKLAII